MSTVLQKVYASAPANDLPIHTLTLLADSFGAIRICEGFDNVTAGLETGEFVEFTASGMGISLPARSVKGSQSLQFQLDNVTKLIRRLMPGIKLPLFTVFTLKAT
jgi:hypothetical protein